MDEVTDPELLKQLNGSQEVTDPAILAQLNGTQAAPQESGFSGWLRNSAIGTNIVNPLARQAAHAIMAGPMMAEDFGVAARNVGGNLYNRIAGNPATPDYELPSTTVNRALDAALPPPTSMAGKVSEFAGSAIMGAGIPAPTYSGNVPANFMPSATPAQQTFAQTRNAGYVVPPSTVNPTTGGKLLESLGGKIQTAQDASIANMPVTNSLARSALGLGTGEGVTQAEIGAVRSQAGQAYQNVIAKIGDTLPTDQAYSQGLAAVAEKYSKIADELGPEFGKPELTNIVQALDKPQMSPQSAITATQVLREKADVAFRAGDKQLGQSFKALSANIEDLIERHLQGIGDTEALAQLRDARQLIAKTYSVQGALNPATGNVNALKLGQQLSKGKPLSGDLFTIAQSAQAYPKAMREVVDSGSVSNTDVILGGLAAVAKHDPRMLLYPFARQGARAFMLSDTGQSMMTGAGIQSPGLAGLAQSLMAQWDLAQ